MEKNFKKKILEKIKSGKIEQKSKLYFLTKSYIFWFFSALSSFVGGIFFSLILLNIFKDYKIFFVSKSFTKKAEGLWEIIPIWALFIFIFFIFISYINYKNTQKSYLKENFLVVLFSVLFSIIIGFSIFFSGVTSKMDKKMQNNFPPYKKHLEKKDKRIKSFLEKNNYEKKDLKNPEIRKEFLNQQKIKKGVEKK